MQLPDLSLIAAHLLAVTIAVFTFAVTLLGNAIEKAKLEVEKAQKEESDQTDIKAAELAKKVHIAQTEKSFQLKEFEKDLKSIKKAQKGLKKKLSRIDRKYKALEFKRCVLIPSMFFAGTYFFSEISKVVAFHSTSSIALWISSVACLAVGAVYLGTSLLLAQEISTQSDATQMARMTAAVKSALFAYDKETQETLIITAVDTKSPLQVAQNSNFSVTLRIVLTGGKIARDVDIWLFFPDDLTAVNPVERKVFRQRPDFTIPNAHTLKIGAGDMRHGVNFRTEVTFKTPQVAGQYLFIYQVRSEQFGSPRHELKINVT